MTSPSSFLKLSKMIETVPEIGGAEPAYLKHIQARVRALFSKQHGEITIKKHGKELFVEETDKTKLTVE